MHAVLLTDEELAALSLPADRPKPRVVIGLEGGLAQGYSANSHGIEVTVLDYDEHDHRVTQPEDEPTTAYAYDLSSSFDPEWVNSEIILSGPEEE